MPLPYTVADPFDMPRERFNADAIAVVGIGGGRYGGHWVINAVALDTGTTFGRIDTCYDLDRCDLTKDERYPGLAMDTAVVWLNDEAVRRGWQLLHWEDLGGQFGPDERPYFITGRALIGSEEFVPMPSTP